MARPGKDWKKLIQQAKDEGWRLDTTKRHPRLVPPNGGQFIVFPATPSDHRAYLNARSEMRRRGIGV